MPNKDGTGPCGKGAKTGRQNGNCKDAKLMARRGCGPCGCRMGRGFGQRNLEEDSE